MTRVLATGTFDLLHPGHLFFLEEAKKLGDELYVIVARDSKIEHKPKPIIPEEQRVRMITALKVVDYAILGSEGDMFEPLEEIQPDIIALGHDQVFDSDKLKEELAKRGFASEITRIEKSEACRFCSSGKIIKEILKRYGKKD
ncbi:FAD synthetase [Methanohalophilus levihalophilus]|nr:FAD synthase [Methanohalophilus levihalophilus]MBP2029776.1 FAD synthetase [Methanohalophilus levihalophilus]